MIFEHLSYKSYINDLFESMPNKGRGQYKKLSDFLEVSTVVISQTLKGDRDFSVENAFKTTKFLKLVPFEAQYFLKMVEHEKAGHHELKAFFLQELRQMQKDSKKVKNRYSKTTELADEDKFQFYSSRYYSAIRMASSLPNVKTKQQMSQYFNLPLDKVEEILEFLVRADLCVQDGDTYNRGPQNTFLPASSPYIKNHHKNWRLYSIQKIDQLDPEDELMYTAPMSLSKEAFEQLKLNLLQTIQDAIKLIGPTKDEMVACLNIDFLKV